MPNEPPNSGASSRLDELIAEYLLAAEAGAQPNLEKMIAENPAEASGLRAFHDDWQAAKNYFPPTAAFVPAQPATTSPLPSTAGGESVHSTIAGKYKLLQEIGEGGMGTVFMAQQTSDLKRLVAVKLIRRDLTAAKLLARFEAERQALALMDHPNIAKVFDAGTTDSGRPFYVMELVKGLPLLRYCDERRLSIPDRLALFTQICQGVQHAHQKGIIHRDLKPSNILVEEHDGKPVPKIIDFGLAKSTTMELTDKTLFTDFGMVLGTYLYMAPEQAVFNALDIDTRADVYALGVILYELLTGSTPIERAQLQAVALDEVLRTIREVEAPKPSDRLSKSGSLPSVAATRNIEPAQLSRMMRGDLDWIVMKALEKERGRRYDTPAALAEDLARFRELKPVLAGPPSNVYRFRKFVRRNRVMFFAISTVLLLSIVAIAAGVVQEVRRSHAAKNAADAAKAVAVAEAKQTQLLREKDKLVFERKLESEHALAVRNAAEYVQLLTRIRERREVLETGWTTAGLQDLRKAASLQTSLRNLTELRSLAAILLMSPDVKADPDWDLAMDPSREPSELAYSPSGKLLAIALSGSFLAQHPTVLVIETATGKIKHRLIGEDSLLSIGFNKNASVSVRFGIDDTILFHGTRKGRLHRWNLSVNPPISISIQASNGGIMVSVTPDGKHVVTNARFYDKSDESNPIADSRLRCWNSSSLQLVAETETNDKITSHVFVLPSGKGFLAKQGNSDPTRPNDDELVQLSLPSLKFERKFRQFDKIAFQRGGMRFATNQGQISIRSSQNFEPEAILQAHEGGAATQSLDFLQFANRDETLAALNFSSNSVLLWRPARASPWARLRLPQKQTLRSFSIAPNGKHATLAADGTVAQFSINSQSDVRVVHPQQSDVWAVGVAGDDSEFSTNLSNTALRRYRTSTPETILRDEGLGCRESIIYSPDGRWIVTGNVAGARTRTFLLGVADRQANFSPRIIQVESDFRKKFYPDEFVGWGWTSQGYLVAALHTRLMVWNLAEKEPHLIYAGTTDNALGTASKYRAFSQSGDEAIAVDIKGFVHRRKFDGQRFSPAKQFLVKLSEWPSACIRHEKNEMLAIGCLNGQVAIVDLAAQNVVGSNESVHRDRIVSMIWCQPQRLISASRDGLIAVWRISGAKLELDFQFRTIAGIRNIASPNSGQKIYCCLDGDDCIEAFDLNVMNDKFVELGIQSPSETHAN